jgi:hypothetical protein
MAFVAVRRRERDDENDACDGAQEATNSTLSATEFGESRLANIGRAKRFAAYRKPRRAPMMLCVAAAGMLTAYIKVQESRIV